VLCACALGCGCGPNRPLRRWNALLRYIDTEIANLRQFDVKAFHDRVLEDGAVPLTFLREKVARWRGAAK
jgi:uncharacterized protein (DUF885 family)